jgi:hypothetical protein
MSYYFLRCAALLALLPIAAQGQSFVPCGGAADKLWSWAWAGESGEHVTSRVGDFDKLVITDVVDLSGNGHHYYNHDLGGPYGPDQQTNPAFEPNGFTAEFYGGSYSTTRPVLAVETYNDGTLAYVQSLKQQGTMVANGGFYLAFAGADTRGDGDRFMWGTTTSNSVRFNQAYNRIHINIDGNNTRLSDDFAVPNGGILIEVWREDSGALHVWADGVDVTDGSPTDNGTFSMTGTGGPLGVDSAWDDYAFEYIACDALPSATQRAEVREYLRAKWELFGDVIRPNPPILTVE